MPILGSVLTGKRLCIFRRSPWDCVCCLRLEDGRSCVDGGARENKFCLHVRDGLNRRFCSDVTVEWLLPTSRVVGEFRPPYRSTLKVDEAPKIAGSKVFLNSRNAMMAPWSSLAMWRWCYPDCRVYRVPPQLEGRFGFCRSYSFRAWDRRWLRRCPGRWWQQ